MNIMKSALMSLRLICLTLFFASAFGADQLPRTLEAASDGVVSIENKIGRAHV